MNCKPFLLLRTCSLQVQVVSNTRARYFLPISVEHPLTWHSLVYSHDSLRENLRGLFEGTRTQGAPQRTEYQKSWHKAGNGGNLPGVSQLEAVENDLEVLEDQRRQKGFLHQLSLRQQITLGALHLGADEGNTFFDNLTKQASGGQPRAGYRVSEVRETPPTARSSPDSSLNRMNVLFCRDVNQGIAKGQQKRVSWPYSPQATLLTAMSKGSSIMLPSKARLTTNYTTPSDSVASSKALVKERIRTLTGAGFANVLQRQMDETALGARDREAEASSWLNPPNLDLQLPTSLLKFVTKTRRTPLITNRKPNHLSLASLLLTTNFCTKVVSNNSYLLRFLGTINLPSANRGSRDVAHLLTSLKRHTDDSIRIESQNSFGSNTGGVNTSNISKVLDGSSTVVVGGISPTLETSKSPASYVTGASYPRPNMTALMRDSKWDRPVSLEERLSPAMGELVSQDLYHDGRYLGISTSLSQSHHFSTKSEKDSHSSIVLLTESDQISMSLSKQRANVSVGQFVTLGEEFVSNYAALASGQIVAIEQNKITLRRTQALLFYAQGVTHVNHGQWVNKNAPILTLTYQKLVTGDIVQGIPKIEQFFEAPATRDGEPLSNSLQSRLRKTYNRLKNSLPHVQAVKHSLEEIQQVLVEGFYGSTCHKAFE